MEKSNFHKQQTALLDPTLYIKKKSKSTERKQNQSLKLSIKNSFNVKSKSSKIKRNYEGTRFHQLIRSLQSLNMNPYIIALTLSICFYFHSNALFLNHVEPLIFISCVLTEIFILLYFYLYLKHDERKTQGKNYRHGVK